MFEAIKRIRAIIDKTHPRGHLPYAIKDIHAAIWQVTGIDQLRFNGYHDPDHSNPIWGRFRRYENAALGPYQGKGCVVEIDYNKALESKPHYLRYTIVKELCHALETDPSVRVNLFPDLEQLINALQSAHANEVGAIFKPFLSEKTAEVFGLELLCPVRDRRRLIEQRSTGADLSDMAIAKAFWIPVEHVKFLFDPEFVAFMEKELA